MLLTVESFDFIDSMILEIDQPSTVASPESFLQGQRAVELAEELNVLLSKPGANVTIPDPTTASAASLNLLVATPGRTTAGGSQDLAFPWQRGDPTINHPSHR